MKTKFYFKAMLCLVAWVVAGASRADDIPYPDPGSINYTNYTLTAVANGDITIYYTGSGDATFGSIGMLVNGVSTGVFGLNSQNAAIGDSFNLGYVNAGDTITFELLQTLNYGLGGIPAIPQIYSDPTLNAPYDNQNHGGAALPGFNHVYVANYTATGDVAPADGLPGIPLGAGIPAGLFIGFEGNPIPGNPNYFATDDYNSYTFVATDVAIFGVAPIPEPSVGWLALLGGGVMLARRRFFKAAPTLRVIAVGVGMVGSARADLIPYPNPGNINYTTYTFTAMANGNVTAYFTGSGDATFGSIGMLDNGVSTGVFGLSSQTAAFGDSFNLGTVNAGDIITFELLQTLNYGLGGWPAIGQIYSDPTLNAPYDNQNHGGAMLPGFNHVYAANYSATGDVAPADGLPGIPLSAGIPAGVFVGFEGNPIPGNPNYFSTDDYNSYTFVVTDVSLDGLVANDAVDGASVPDGYNTAMALGLTLAGLGFFGLLGMAAKKA